MNGNTELDITQEKKNLKALILEKEKLFTLVFRRISRVKDEIFDFRKVYDQKIRKLNEKLKELDDLLYKYHHISEYVDEFLNFTDAEKIYDSTMKERQERIEEEFRKEYKVKNTTDRKIGMSEMERAELKRLYRNLVRIFHPDKTGGDEEMMKLINKAYKEGNLSTLRDLDLENLPEKEDESLLGLRYKLKSVERSIEKAEIELKSLKKSDMYVLKRSLLKIHKASDDVMLSGLASDLRKKIVKKEQDLEHFIEKYGLTAELAQEVIDGED